MKFIPILLLSTGLMFASCGSEEAVDSKYPANPLDMDPASYSTACDCAGAMGYVAEAAKKEENSDVQSELKKMYNKIDNNCVLKHKINHDEIEACTGYEEANAIMDKISVH